MRLNEKNAESLAASKVVDDSELVVSGIADHRSYHELEDTPVLEMDSLVQLKTNLEILADLTSRLTFLNREIRYVMKVD